MLFKNALIKRINFWGTKDYFFKHNFLSFTNETFDVDINSDVRELYFYRCDNLALDSKILNAYVFKNLQAIFTYESLKLIDNEIFGRLENLTYFQIRASYFRKLVHKQGIEWLKSKNRGLNVNLSDPKELGRHQSKIFTVVIQFFWGHFLSDVFPDTDFCLYKDFPVEQLVVFIHFINNVFETLLVFKIEPSCTFRWIDRYYKNIRPFLNSANQYWTSITLNAESNMTITCDFQKMLDNCNRHKFQASLIWDKGSTKLLTKYVQVFLTSSSVVISLFGAITNLLLIYVILNKNNSDIFKGLKQYPYLCSLSVFNMITLFIQLISWLSECNKTYDVFCPDTRRIVFFQFFKIIFKETIIVALRFMSNFAYMAFAFNRIALIGQNHAKIVEKLAKWKFKKYMLITGFISVILSIIKGFKYHVRILILKLPHN